MYSAIGPRSGNTTPANLAFAVRLVWLPLLPPPTQLLQAGRPHSPTTPRTHSLTNPLAHRYYLFVYSLFVYYLSYFDQVRELAEWLTHRGVDRTLPLLLARAADGRPAQT